MADPGAALQLHLEPKQPIEVATLTAAMNSIARQYQIFASRNDYVARISDAKLLVSSVRPGSIDISFLPDIATALAAGAVSVIDQLKVVNDFGGHLKWLLERFMPSKGAPKADEPTLRDCDDAINIVKPIADNGGSQTFNTFNGVIHQPVIVLNMIDAKEVLETAGRIKHELQFPRAAPHQRAPLIWTRLDRDSAKSRGTTPDKGLIESLDPKPKPVFFADHMSHVKSEMIQDEANPYKKVYFVDVEVSEVAGKVVSYMIVGYHGKDEIDFEIPHDDTPPMLSGSA